MTIVDTTVWIDYLREIHSPQTGWLDHRLPEGRIALTDMILCEILRGIKADATFREVSRELRKFEIFDTGGTVLAVESAQNFRTLRTRGITIRKSVDCLIATFCIREGHSLLHRDRDFDPFEQHLGLRVIHPAARPASTRDLQ